MKRTALTVPVLLLLAGAPAALAAINPPHNPDQYVGNCGDREHGPGCNNVACQACVCSHTATCCTTDWNFECLGVAGAFCEAECFAVVGNCGVPRPEPGCSDRICEACVCAQFDALGASCCEQEWNESCAQLADGILANNEACIPVCLIANRPEPSPAASPYGLLVAALAASGVAWWRLRRRTVS